MDTNFVLKRVAIVAGLVANNMLAITKETS
jgi:hypothetical protein